MSFRRWTLRRIILMSVAWVLIVPVALAWHTLEFLPNTGGTGIAAVSVGLDSLLLPTFIPPVALILVWLAARRPAVGEQ